MSIDPKALDKEWKRLKRQEEKLEAAAQEARPAGWKAQLAAKVPARTYESLEAAFGKAFGLVFSQGRVILEKGYDKEALLQDHEIRDYAVQLKGGRRELRHMHKSASKAANRNLAITTVEGIGLGALGIGLPDIVLFLSTLLKSVYETSLSYGFDYAAPSEQLLILKMMAAALSHGEERAALNRDVDRLLEIGGHPIAQAALDAQMRQTASVFALDMLLLKFLQGTPIVGIIGGAANPVYYRRVMSYVQLKYRKRYLMGLNNVRQPF